MGKFLFFVAFAFCAWIGINFIDAHEKDQKVQFWKNDIEGAVAAYDKGESLLPGEWGMYEQKRKTIIGVRLRAPINCSDQKGEDGFTCSHSNRKSVAFLITEITGPKAQECYKTGCSAGIIPNGSLWKETANGTVFIVRAPVAFAP